MSIDRIENPVFEPDLRETNTEHQPTIDITALIAAAERHLGRAAKERQIAIGRATSNVTADDLLADSRARTYTDNQAKMHRLIGKED